MKIGLTLPHAVADDGIVPRYRDIRNAAVLAESQVFDSVWVMDHLLFQWEETPPGGVWEGVSYPGGIERYTFQDPADLAGVG